MRWARALQWSSLLILAAFVHDAGADPPSRAALDARRLILGLDLEQARAVLAKANPADPSVGYEQARLALYEGDCDAAALALGTPAIAKVDEEDGLGEIARGCTRTLAGTTLFEDKAQGVWIRFQDDQDQALAPLLVDTIAHARDTLTRDLGVDWPRPTRVVVVSDLHALSAMTGLPYKSASTTGTVGVAKWGRVTLLSPRASQHGFPWRDTLAHELTHLAVTRASADRAPLWLQEGVAKREQIRWRPPNPFDDRPSPESVVAYGIERHLDLALDKLGASVAMLPSAEQAMVAFAEVTSFIRLLTEQAGDDALKKLLVALRETPLEPALVATTGANLSTWEARWRAHLASLGAPPPAALVAAESKDAAAAREHVRLAELLIGRAHGAAASSELDTIASPLLGDPHVRYLKGRALEPDPRARTVLGDPPEVSTSYGPWWAIRGRLIAPEAFADAVAEDPFDVEAACESLDGSAKPGDALCAAARAAGFPDVGKD